MAVVDTTIVAIALPSMRRELSFAGADAGWILNGYALTFGGLVLLLGRAGDLFGRRRLFVAGLAVFAAASLLGGFSWEPWILVFARFIQGVGAAALVHIQDRFRAMSYGNEHETSYLRTYAF